MSSVEVTALIGRITTRIIAITGPAVPSSVQLADKKKKRAVTQCRPPCQY